MYTVLSAVIRPIGTPESRHCVAQDRWTAPRRPCAVKHPISRISPVTVTYFLCSGPPALARWAAGEAVPFVAAV
jgi:hypothetical protein